MTEFRSKTGELFWQLGLAWPRYCESDTERLFYTNDGIYMMPEAGHQWIDVPFARYINTQTMDYVRQHGREVTA